MNQDAINNRYSVLAGSDCCLSCGSAVKYAEPRLGETCLDLGSGRGTDVLRMATQVGPAGFVWGIDISDGMLDKARATAEKVGARNVRFEKAELEKLPLESGTVDLVISNCVLNHAQDKLQVWREIFRVLKPGGRFVVSDIFSTAPVPEKYRTDPAAVAECWAGADTRDQYLGTVVAAGFTTVDILEESQPYAKGEVEVCSFTLAAQKTSPARCACRS